MSAKVGSFNIGTGAVSSTVPITGLGFQPTCVIFWWGRATATGQTTEANFASMGLGAVTSTTERWGQLRVVDEAGALGICASRSDCCILHDDAVTGGAGNVGRADIQSFDADGFTLVIEDVFTRDLRVHYLALDHADAYAGTLTPTSGTGSLPVTGVGFQPEFVLSAPVIRSIGDKINADGTSFAIGVAANTTDEWVCGFSTRGADLADRYAYEGESWLRQDRNGPPEERFELTSFDADGFTLNKIESVSTWDFCYLALAGGQYHVGSIVSSTGTSNVAETGVGFQPEALMFASHGKTLDAQNVNAVDAVYSLGAASGTTERATVAISSNDGVNDAWNSKREDAIYVRPNLADAEAGRMDLVSLDSDGFTTVMDDADPDAAWVGYFAFGSAAGDVTAPVLTSASGTQTGTTTADLSVTVDEVADVYVSVTTSATTPSPTQIEAGQDHTGAVAAFADSSLGASAGAVAFSATGLTASTGYYAHYWAEDAAANSATAVSSALFTTGAAGIYGTVTLLGVPESGALVYLINQATDTVTSTTTTDGNGDYSFTGLASGTYHVVVESASGTAPSVPDVVIP